MTPHIAPLIVAGLSSLAASTASAQSDLMCNFRSLCYQGESCNENKSSITVSRDSGTMTAGIHGEMPIAFKHRSLETHTYVASDGGHVFMLSAFSSGTAQLSVNVLDMPISYIELGRCEETNG